MKTFQEFAQLEEKLIDVNTRTYDIHKLSLGDFKRNFSSGLNKELLNKIKSILKQSPKPYGWDFTLKMEDDSTEIISVMVKSVEVNQR